MITSRFLTNTLWVHILALWQLRRLSTQSHWITARDPNSLPLCPGGDLAVFFLGQCWCLRVRTFSWKKKPHWAGVWGEPGKPSSPVLQPEKSPCAYGKPVTSLCLHCPFVKQGNYNLPALYGCWEATLMFVNHFEDGSDCSLLWQVKDLWPLSFLPVAWQLS